MNYSKQELKKAAETVVKDIFAVQPNEKVLIITNPVEGIDVIAHEIFAVAREHAGEVNLIYQPTKRGDEYMDQAVVEAIKRQPDVLIGIRSNSFGLDPEGECQPYQIDDKKYTSLVMYLSATGKMRSAWSSEIGADDFSRLVLVDYDKMRILSDKIEARLNQAVKAIVRTNGVEMYIDIDNRLGMPDKGDFRTPMLYGNIPSGEVCISPELGKVNGEIVLDGVISLDAGVLDLKTPVKLIVKDNYIEEIQGGQEAQIIEKDLVRAENRIQTMYKKGEIDKDFADAMTRNTRAIGELGIGFNENARDDAPSLMEAEKAYGTTHVAIGFNYDGDQQSPIHNDAVAKTPELVLVYPDGREELILKDKEFLL